MCLLLFLFAGGGEAGFFVGKNALYFTEIIGVLVSFYAA